MVERGPKHVLSLLDATAIIVGIVVGAGIFRLPSLVAAQVGGAEWAIMAVWFLGGVISLLGALCFSELVSTYPDAGGEYHILGRAYGRDCAFMFAWARMTVVQTGSIALLAYIFGDYAAQLVPLGPYGAAIHAAGLILLLTGLNLAGIRETRNVQNILFIVTLMGILVLVVAGLLLIGPGDAATTDDPMSGGGGRSGFGLAMVFVLLTYGGWNESAYISAELRGGPRRIVQALLLSIGIITLLYLAINLAYLHGLGAAGMAGSQAVASDLMQAAFGPTGAMLFTILVLLVVAASINVTIFTGARTNFALGRDFALFRALHHWDEARGAPSRALLVQGAIALGLVLLGALNRKGVETVVEYLSPVFWFFFLLMGLALFMLRRRDPARPRPFSVPFYPVVPLLFCLSSASLLYSSLVYTGAGALFGVGVLLLGLPVLFWARRRQRRIAAGDPENRPLPVTHK